MALGLVFKVVSGGMVSQETGMLIGALIVLIYTTFGGMWSVALLDFVQMTVIMGGMLFIAWYVSGMTGGAGAVVQHAQASGKLDFFPKGGYTEWVPFVGAWVTMMLGSIPQQDVFQRITAARNHQTAVRGSVLGGSLYFVFAFVPMFLAYAATLVDPQLFGRLLEQDSQLVLPTLILDHTPLFAQVIFFGALLSAIMSCSSATLLAPSVAFTENILKHFVFRQMDDRQFLRAMRITLWGFGGMVLLVALNSELSIFKMVENAYKITLVAAFTPLAFGLYWKRANTQGALAAMALGLSSWLLCEMLEPSQIWPPQLIGLLMSMVGMVVGSLLPNRVPGHTPEEPEHAYLHHHAAGHTGHVAESGHTHPADHA
jgi:Na+/proline symporter